MLLTAVTTTCELPHRTQDSGSTFNSLLACISCGYSASWHLYQGNWLFKKNVCICFCIGQYYKKYLTTWRLNCDRRGRSFSLLHEALHQMTRYLQLNWSSWRCGWLLSTSLSVTLDGELTFSQQLLQLLLR